MIDNEYRLTTCANKSPDCACSTFIDDVTITYGRGKLDQHGCFEISCLECDRYRNLVDDLAALQATENEGRGISCVRTIVKLMMQAENLELAQGVRQTEGDKTRSYPKVEALLYQIFGCRLHGHKNCADPLCRALKKDLEI